MLKHIEPFHREKSARTFRNFESFATEDPIVLAHQLELGITATPQNMLVDNWDIMEYEEVRSRIELLDIHLKSRCGGLLEIHDFETLILEINCLLTVQYLHRTVRVYL
jgi:hypothetical protein